MKWILTKETREFIAKYLGDLSKAILTVGLASYFFKDMPWYLRIGFLILAVVFLIISVILPGKENKYGSDNCMFIHHRTRKGMKNQAAKH